MLTALTTTATEGIYKYTVKIDTGFPTASVLLDDASHLAVAYDASTRLVIQNSSDINTGSISSTTNPQIFTFTVMRSP